MVKSSAERLGAAALLALGLSVFGWGAVVAVAEGVVLTAPTVLLLVVALCIAMIGACAATPWAPSVAWAALSLVGFATALQLVDAGGAVAYQHLDPAVAPLHRDDVVLLVAVAAQGALAAVGIRPYLSKLRRWLVGELGLVRGSILLGSLVVLSASPLRDLRGYAVEMALSTGMTMVALTTFVLAVLGLPPRSSDAVIDSIERVVGPARARGWDSVALGAAVFTAVLCGGLARLVYEAHPHISDEFGFLFQASYFAKGALTAPGVPVPDLFESYQIECTQLRCMSVLQPGWPALLALGVRAGAPWLVNPLIAAVNVLLAFELVRELYGPRLARLVVVLLASSPWFLFLGMSLMNHQATLMFALTGAVGTVLAIRRRKALWALVAGAGVGLTSLMRPMDGVIAAVVVGLPLLVARSTRRRAVVLALFMVGIGGFGLLNLMYNRAVTGNPMEFPVTRYVNEIWGEGSNNLGFGANRGVYPEWAHMDPFPGHSPFQAGVNAVLNLTALQTDLFGWAIGSFTPLLLFLLWWRFEKADLWLLGSILAVVGFYSLYWFASGPDFAARYWFLTVVPFAGLTARGFSSLAKRSGDSAGFAVAVAIGLLVTQSLAVFVPWRSADKYHRYIGTGPMMRDIIRDGTWPPDVYVVGGPSHPDFAAAMIYKAPDLAGPGPVIVYDTGEDVAARLRAAFPHRRLWRVEGPGTTGDVYRIVGPMR